MSLFKKITAEIRQSILNGTLKAGDPLPSVREASEQWGCAPGTVQRAYRELTLQGLIITQVGQGTRVAAPSLSRTTLRRAALGNRVEAFLLEMMAAGYTPQEVEEAAQEVLARWQARFAPPVQLPKTLLRFVGSHDPIMGLVNGRFAALAPDYELTLTFVGSMGGLLALARQGADIAGCHLWDEESDSYNAPFAARLLPGRRVALLTLAYRRLGLIVAPGNPLGVQALADLLRPDVRFANRATGASGRLWLDAQLQRLDLDPQRIRGYEQALKTNLQVAEAVSAGQADVGLGVEAAALACGLDFVLLTRERYDLVIPAQVWDLPGVQALAQWLTTAAAHQAIAALGGYDVTDTGRVAWINETT